MNAAPSEPVAVRPGQLVELRLGAVAAGGSCVARADDGLVVFVRHGLPGERVVAHLTSVGSHFARADAVEVLEASPDRVEPPCAHAGPFRCGGCDFQHISLERQRALKADLVAAALTGIAGVAGADAVVEIESIGPEDGLGWRSRVRFAVDAAGRPGFHCSRSRVIEPVASCPIAAPAVESLGVERLRWRGASEVEVAVGDGGSALVTVIPRRGARVSPPRLERQVPVVVGARRAARRSLSYDVRGQHFEVSGGSFWQVHAAAAEALTAAVLDGLRPQAGERCADLHAGAGLFAVHLALAVGGSGKVLAVERDATACSDAERNAAALPQLAVRRADVDSRLIATLAPLDLVVLDPPRAGAGTGVVGALAELRPAPRRVAYVACDPASFARDLRVLLAAGWTVASLRGFDLFPMTEHVELVAILEPPPASGLAPKAGGAGGPA